MVKADDKNWVVYWYGPMTVPMAERVLLEGGTTRSPGPMRLRKDHPSSARWLPRSPGKRNAVCEACHSGIPLIARDSWQAQAKTKETGQMRSLPFYPFYP
jgi:hypothetical protein